MISLRDSSPRVRKTTCAVARGALEPSRTWLSRRTFGDAARTVRRCVGAAASERVLGQPGSRARSTAIATSCARACAPRRRVVGRYGGPQRCEQLREDVTRERRELGERLREERAVSRREFVTERARAGDEAAQSAPRAPLPGPARTPAGGTRARYDDRCRHRGAPRGKTVARARVPRTY